jgi:hypothetical protein
MLEYETPCWDMAPESNTRDYNEHSSYVNGFTALAEGFCSVMLRAFVTNGSLLGAEKFGWMDACPE